MAKYTNDPPIIYHKKFNDEEKHMYVSLDEKRINNYFLFNKKLLDPYDYDGYLKFSKLITEKFKIFEYK